MVNHQTGIFHVKYLHDRLPSIDKDKNLTTSDIMVHIGRYNSTESVKTLSHIHRGRIQIVMKGTVQMEHEDQSQR